MLTVADRSAARTIETPGISGNRIVSPASGLLLEQMLQIFDAPSAAGWEVLKSILPEYRVFEAGFIHHTPEGTPLQDRCTTALRLCGSNLIELNRDAQAHRSLAQLLDGSSTSHAQYTWNQPSAGALSYSTYARLSQFVRQAVDSDAKRDLISALITYSNAAKVGPGGWDLMRPNLQHLSAQEADAALNEIWRSWKRTSEDPDAALHELLILHPKILCSFDSYVDPQLKPYLLESLEPDFNFGQFLQLENCAGSLASFFRLSPTAQQILLVHALADLSAAQAHLAPGAALVTEPKAQDILAAHQALALGTPEDAYHSYMNHRARKLGITPSTPEGAALIRLGSWLDYHSPEPMTAVGDAVLNLGRGVRDSLIDSLNITGTAQEPALVLYFGPAMLRNLTNGLKPGSPDFRETLVTGLACTTELFERGHAALSRGSNRPVMLFCREAAEAAKDRGAFARQHPVIEPLEGDLRAKMVVRPSSEPRATVTHLLPSAAPMQHREHRIHQMLLRDLTKSESGAAQLLTIYTGFLTQGLTDTSASRRISQILGNYAQHRRLHKLASAVERCIGQLAAYLPAGHSMPEADGETRADELEGEIGNCFDRAQQGLSDLNRHIRELWDPDQLHPELQGPAARVYQKFQQASRKLEQALDSLEPVLESVLAALHNCRQRHTLFAVLRVEQEISDSLLERVALLAHQNRYRGGVPLIHDHGILMREHSLQRLRDMTDRGLQVITATLSLNGELVACGLAANPSVLPQIVPEALQRYRRDRAGYIHLLATAHDTPPLLPAYQLALNGAALNLPSADLAFGRVQADNYISLKTDLAAGFQLFTADSIRVASDLPPDNLALFPGEDAMDAIGVILPLSLQMKRFYAPTALTPREASTHANAVIRRTLPGVQWDYRSALQEGRQRDADRLRYLNIKVQLHQLFQLPSANLLNAIGEFHLPEFEGHGMPAFECAIMAVLPTVKWNRAKELLSSLKQDPTAPQAAADLAALVRNELLSAQRMLARERKIQTAST